MACWVYQGYVRADGYGQAWSDGRPQMAHRLAYEALVGPIPDGLQLDHLCRNRACYNPAHLEPVTARTNTLRGQTQAAVNVAKTHCPWGHPYSVENTTTYKRHRRCLVCHRDRERRRRIKERAS